MITLISFPDLLWKKATRDVETRLLIFLFFYFASPYCVRLQSYSQFKIKFIILAIISMQDMLILKNSTV